jgi:hypothetical protein
MPRWNRAGRMAGTLGFVLLCATASRAAQHDFSGMWKLNHELSEDAAPKIQDAAGSRDVQGRPTWAAETILPWGRGFNEDERVQLRDVLLGAVRALETLEVDQTASEFKTIHGDAGVRIFYLHRTGTGAGLLTGETVKRHAQWKDDALVLESKSGETKVDETFTLEKPDQLVHTLHVEMDLLEHPFDLRLVYDRADR